MSEALPPDPDALRDSPRRRDAGERELLERIAQRDEQALKQLYHAYHQRLARFIVRLTSRYEVAEEVINDTFCVVWQRASEFRGASQVSTWIFGIAYRRTLKSLQRLRLPVEPDATAVEPSEEPQQQLEIAEWLGMALERLPLEQRLVIELAYSAGHSCAEIATIMQCPVNTVKTRMFHARRKLRTVLTALAGGS